MAVKTSHRRQAATVARRLPCRLGGKLHNRTGAPGARCVDCGNTRKSGS